MKKKAIRFWLEQLSELPQTGLLPTAQKPAPAVAIEAMRRREVLRAYPDGRLILCDERQAKSTG